MEAAKNLNRRKHDRYIIDDIPIEDIGSIVEVSRKGLKIKKAPGFVCKDQVLHFNIFTLEIKASVRWDDRNFTGLEISGAFNDPKFIIKRIKRPKETVVPPQMKIQDKAIQEYKKDEILYKMVNLLMEVESPDPDMRKLGTYINEIAVLEEAENKAKEAEKTGEDKTDAEAGKETVPGESKMEHSLKNELIAKAVGSYAGNEPSVADINFAVVRLGYDSVRVLARSYAHKRIFASENALPVFQDSEPYNILKSVVFKKLCRLFGFQYIQPEGNALLSCETVGMEILIRESSGILDNYYKSPYRLYSEVSRMYEKSLFGADPLQISKFYFEKSMGAFGELFNGYALAHNMLSPHYDLSEKMKISLTKNSLIFSYISYLTFLAVIFLIDRDKESGFILSKRLRGRGMNDQKILVFLDECIDEARAIFNDFAVKGSLTRPPLPVGSFNIESYLGGDIRFEYLMRAFRNFNNLNAKRMAIRYEDASYAHFILGRIINSESFGLNSKTFIVVPCESVSDEQWYVEDFGYFDLLVFKDINKLPNFHMSTFDKLWGSFEGQIIATFSNIDFLDYTRPQLYSCLNGSIVDFPSYFLNDAVYKKMVEHTVNYLKPYIGKEKVDEERYSSQVYTMNHIKRDTLLNKEIV